MLYKKSKEFLRQKIIKYLDYLLLISLLIYQIFNNNTNYLWLEIIN